jgi:hypothetical protein
MSKAILIWEARKDPRHFRVYTHPAIDIIARVVCRREIEDARKRVVVERGKYFFQPSIDYIRARLGFRPKNNNYEYKRKSPFREDS